MFTPQFSSVHKSNFDCVSSQDMVLITSFSPAGYNLIIYLTITTYIKLFSCISVLFGTKNSTMRDLEF